MDDLFKKLLDMLPAGLKVTLTFEKAEAKPERFFVTCTDCEWKKDYSRADNAEKARDKHLSTCVKRKQRLNREIPPELKKLVEGFEGENRKNERKNGTH